MPGLKTIYSNAGIPLTDIRASVLRSWMLHNIGDGIFYIATDDPKCDPDYLAKGNFIVVENDKLPAWVGVIDAPFVWHNGYIEVHAYEPAFLLQYRFPPLGAIITGSSGDRFKQLLDFANSQGDTLIKAGNVSDAGEIAGEENLGSSAESIFSIISNLRTNNAMEWVTYPTFTDGGILEIMMDWIPRVGHDTGTELVQGSNLMYGDTPLEESGERINYAEAVCVQADGGVISGVYYEPQPYGIRAVRLTFTDVSDQAQLSAYARAYVEEKKKAYISTPLTAVDVGNTFNDIRLGNTLTHRSKVGFNLDKVGILHQIRLLGFRYDESQKTCELYTSEVL